MNHATLPNICTNNALFLYYNGRVGWAAEAPVIVGERIAAWCAAYLGGVLGVNLFLVSLVFGRRGWWNFKPEERAYEMLGAPALGNPGMQRVGEWQLHSLGK